MNGRWSSETPPGLRVPVKYLLECLLWNVSHGSSKPAFASRISVADKLHSLNLHVTCKNIEVKIEEKHHKCTNIKNVQT